MMIDTHAHLDQIEDLDGALRRAQVAGVTDIVAVSVDWESMQKNYEIARRDSSPRVHYALGIHPGTLKPEETEASFAWMREHLAGAVAVGETGLDFWYKWARQDPAEKDRQRRFLERHVALAKEFDKPLVIHSRGAWSETIAMAQAAGLTHVLFHWYSGPQDILARILEAGYYISVGPSLAYSAEAKQAARAVPMDRVVLETDSPVYFREGAGGFNAEPCDVLRPARFLAELKGLTLAQVQEQTRMNAIQFFGLST